ncbi:hypothetical protein MHZ92_20040 [Sporosarcina sp. ACRSL]|uniref:hypothetical protein n=1 Tax=Sporosarcina sp. ACRSL TaxID=2918215 RepID=UPI001EF747FB|nr:hypothetical protein [Sporosarcina sp. ACRSL]MCG7346400.1 hypothetical protein [Sporosarcina sp. ACRSL]
MLTIKDELMEIEKGWTVHIRTMPIIEGVEVVTIDNKEASLRVNGEDIIEFNWTQEAATLFANIDVCEPIELLELLARLNRQLNGRLGASRKGGCLMGWQLVPREEVALSPAEQAQVEAILRLLDAVERGVPHEAA